MVVEAAAPILLDGADTYWHDRARVYRAELNAIRVINDQLRDLTREQDQTLQATRDRHADLEVQVVELRDLLEQSISGQADCWRCDMPGGYHLVDCAVAAALQTDGPARGHAILQEVQRLRQFEKAIRTALQPWYWTGIDADGKSYRDVVEEVATAHTALDQAAPGEVDDG